MAIQPFGDNFIHLRDTYVFPLLEHGIKRDKYLFWGLKNTVCNKLRSISKEPSKDIIEIELSQNDFFKSLVCEIELFLNKTIIQYSVTAEADLKHKSKTWSYVSFYYFFFFSTTTLMRFLQQGFVYLDSSHVKKLNNFSGVVNSEPIKLNSGNYFFSVKEFTPEGNVVIILQNKGEGLHRMTWVQLENIIRNDFLTNADSDEKVIYKQILSLVNYYKAECPSTLRNKLNYTAESSIIDFENSIPCIEFHSIQRKYIKTLLSLDTNLSDSAQITWVTYYSLFIFNLTFKLYDEYINRSKHGKDFQMERDRYMKNNSIVFTEV